eukprot:1393844-Rhodomonas_salina.2
MTPGSGRSQCQYQTVRSRRVGRWGGCYEACGPRSCTRPRAPSTWSSKLGRPRRPSRRSPERAKGKRIRSVEQERVIPVLR